ncbi:hypothetical protein Pmani_011821 [Petrolisthes manimaculis]|uniref:Uncharacterized protein n=1 Tax=Petrolisthes manimaculis TaxID=1843537 RepID=A0AAE1PYP0_9EUCA|nr:hypothetical protein Pmani_011821 [Petrolisthes manimaculis]
MYTSLNSTNSLKPMKPSPTTPFSATTPPNLARGSRVSTGKNGSVVPYWVPDTYKTEEELPKEMPQYLKNNIIDSIYDVGHISKFAWVSCEVVSGEGYCSLTPWFGFPDYFFPYNTNTNYRSPVLSARVDWRGAQKKYVKLRFQMWAKNLDPKETIQTITVEANQSN